MTWRAIRRRRQGHENRTPGPSRRATPFKAAAPPVFTPRYSAATGLQDLGSSASEADLRGTSLTGHELSVEMSDATTASDWLPTFEFGLANDSRCLKRPVRVSGAEGRFTLKLDARQSSSRWQPLPSTLTAQRLHSKPANCHCRPKPVIRTMQDRSFRLRACRGIRLICVRITR